jgi:hypothetical protein
MSETANDGPMIRGEIVRIKIERKRLNTETGELESIEPIVIETEKDGSH